MPVATVHPSEAWNRLDAALAEARVEERIVGVLTMRIENLRTLTLAKGYALGGAVLQHFDRTLTGLARRQDWQARIGDSEFVLVAPGLRSVGPMQLAANKLLRLLAEPLLHDGNPVPIQVRIGIACGPQHGTDGAALLLAAERALLQAEQRHQPMALYVAADNRAVEDDWQIEELFDAAFERGEFELWYQPKIRLADRRLVGCEGLSRWTSSVLGPIAPGRFIPVAERSGKIDRLTWSALNTALQQQSGWPDPELSVAVNVSALSLQSDDLIGQIENALGLWNADATRLTVEVTESAVMDDPENSFRRLAEIRALGVRISIDDFGTGQSSLAYFKSLPADELKIDRSFVMHLTSDAADRHIVQTIIELSHRLGHKVVAEGIEDGETADLLAQMGCDTAQGYHFARPMPPAQFLEFARRTIPPTR